MNVFVLVAHTRRGSLCESLAQSITEGARAAGCMVRECHLADLRFDPDVRGTSPCEQPLEDDLQRAWSCIVWAQHLVVVFPAWWGSGPARLKAFLDRTLLPGTAFAEAGETGYRGLLGGRSAHLVATVDMPPWVYRWVYRAPGITALKRSTLGFCGIKTTRVLILGPVRSSLPEQRADWLARSRSLGLSLKHGPFGPVARPMRLVVAWVRALRLHFYPMSWMAYTLGALIAPARGLEWHTDAYLMGYACLFLIKAATVFTNERVDLPSDARNQYAGPFNGGSRVLVDGSLRSSMLSRATVGAMACAMLIAVPLVTMSSSPVMLAALLLVLTILALGYSASPLCLSWRGFGELDVAATHSVGAIGWGLMIQGGHLLDPALWAFAVPLGLSILPAIILSGLPDREADGAVGKRTLAVRWGLQRARDAAALALLAANLGLWSCQGHITFGATSGLWPWVAAHSLLLMGLLYRPAPKATQGRIDATLAVALALILWFVAVPLVRMY